MAVYLATMQDGVNCLLVRVALPLFNLRLCYARAYITYSSEVLFLTWRCC
ncbi:MAG: hypothetical protein ACI8Z9_000949 [Paraglaciecola sp.]|jgi:hypothetical protein